MGHHEEAERLCGKNLEGRPDDGETLHLLGRIAAATGRDETARDFFKRALETFPQQPDWLMSLADCHLRMDEPQEGERLFKRLLEVTPDNGAAHLALGDLMRERNDIEGAEHHYRAALVLDKCNGYAHAGLGYCQAAVNQVEAATRSLAAATAYAPFETDFQKTLFHIDKYNLALWHLGMINDQVRNDAYQAAIDQSAGGAEVVLEIGTGSGLLAMMAARAGAGHVVTCETEARVAEIAGQIVAENGYQDRVTVIHKRSAELVVGQDLPQRADLLICEIFDSGLLAEDALFSIYQARENLLKPHGTVIPARARLMCALVACGDVDNMRRVGKVNGFDLSSFNRIANRRVEARDKEKLELDFLSDPVELFTFDFHWDHQLAGEAQYTVPVIKDGCANALIFWFHLDLTQAISLSTHPAENQTHWQNPIQVLQEAVQVKRTDLIVLETTYLRQFLFVDISINQV